MSKETNENYSGETIQFNVDVPVELADRFDSFLSNNKRKLFKTKIQAAVLVLETGLDVLEEQIKKSKNKK